MISALRDLKTFFAPRNAALPTVNAAKHGQVNIKQASATPDEAYIVLRDGTGALDYERIVTKDYSDTLYSPTGHDHALQYAPAAHNHDGVYAPLIHDSPFVLHTSANSADTSSTTSTSVYSTNVSLSVPLPSGTWTVTVQGTGLYSHSSSGGSVAHRVRIASDTGTVLSAAMPQTGVRSGFSATHSLSGQTGTITVYLEYRVVASGTAYAGGGTLMVIATRTA